LCIWMDCQECASNMKASSVMWVGRMLRGECQIPLWEMSWQKHELCTVQAVCPKRVKLVFSQPKCFLWTILSNPACWQCDDECCGWD
jgi:hypothetical protein